MEITSCLYLGQATRRYLASTFGSGSGSPRIASLCMMLERRRAKSSMDSPSRNMICSYSAWRLYAVDFLTRSSPMRIERIASHASLADGLVARVGTISGGTPEQIASSAVRSSWNSPSPDSMMSHK